MQSKNIESISTLTIAQNTMPELLRGHYKTIIKICEFKTNELNTDEFNSDEFKIYGFKARLNRAIGTGLPNRKP